MLRQLGLLDGLDQLIPDSAPSPIELVRRNDRVRQRGRTRRPSREAALPGAGATSGHPGSRSVIRTASVLLWGSLIGAANLPDGTDVANFEFEPGFASSGVGSRRCGCRCGRAPSTDSRGSRGRASRPAPGSWRTRCRTMYGNALIDAWLASQGRGPESFNRDRAPLLRGRPRHGRPGVRACRSARPRSRATSSTSVRSAGSRGRGARPSARSSAVSVAGDRRAEGPAGDPPRRRLAPAARGRRR